MFPNFRLMIAAVAASIVALSCGFGVFAAFRVNHEPLARLPPASAPLRLVVGNAGPLFMVIAATAPVDRGLQLREPHGADGATASPAPKLDPGDGVEPAPAAAPAAAVPAAAAPEPRSAAAEEAAVPVAPASASPAAQPTEQKAAAVAPTADDHAADASIRDLAPPPAGSAGAPASSPDASQQAALPDAKPNGAAAAAAAPAPAVAPVAAIEPPTDQALPVEETRQWSEPPGNTAGEAVKAAPQVAAKAATKTARTRVAARTHRRHRLRGSTVADSGLPTYMSPQPQFQTGPQGFDTPAAQAQPTSARRVKITSRRTAKKHSALGGPFVNPNSR